MKKSLFAIVSLILSLNFALASDLLFKATNGVLNENSLGVKKLDDEEMKRVKGGYYRVPYLDTSTRTYWLISDSFYAAWNNGLVAPTPGTATVRDKMGYSGKNVVILGSHDTHRFAKYEHAFVAYDTFNKMRVSEEFVDSKYPQYSYYVKRSLSFFTSYTRSSNTHRF